jgi:hypothetical protein
MPSVEQLPTMAELKCSLAEAAGICKIPDRTLWRWRRERHLTVAADWEGLTAAGRTELLAGRRPLGWGAQLNIEDLARLMLVSHMGTLGWDRQRLMSEALGHPWAIFTERDGEPDYLLIYLNQQTGKLDRTAIDTFESLTALLRQIPSAYVANLYSWRNAAATAMAGLATKPDRDGRKSAHEEETALKGDE